jgi:hypothetical protein
MKKGYHMNVKAQRKLSEIISIIDLTVFEKEIVYTKSKRKFIIKEKKIDCPDIRMKAAQEAKKNDSKEEAKSQINNGGMKKCRQ